MDNEVHLYGRFGPLIIGGQSQKVRWALDLSAFPESGLRKSAKGVVSLGVARRRKQCQFRS
jgi:hypothetical protein